ncbi:MAG: glycosyltransferase family 2 protein [Acidobacteria bacterium]|nr:glycosyltransferase family 2 protein [Acidobacteriota bacterium]
MPQNTPGISLSVVIPAYNEAGRIVSTLEQVLRFLHSRPQTYEVVIVDDGSTDDTVERVQNVRGKAGNLRVLRHLSNQGKGAAVRTGMLAARGEYLLFTDADLSAPIGEMDRLLEPLRNGYDVVIGSRALRREWIQGRSSLRRNAAKVFNYFLRRITGLDFQDTQCGFKALRRAAAQAIFPLQRISGFGFDVELLYLGRKLGFRLLEVPVHWAHSEGTKVRLWRDGSAMFLDLVKIRWNDWQGRYSMPSGSDDFPRFEELRPSGQDSKDS